MGLIDISQCPLNIHNVRGYFRIREHLKRAFQVREVAYNTELLTKFQVINGPFVPPVKAAHVPCFENTLLIQPSGWSVFRLGVILLPAICF